MCGIAGFVGAASNIAGNADNVAEAMAASLRHRGPDDQGVWLDPAAGTALIHRRLSIIDLSAAGHQPMLSADERLVISYNGEVYSYQPIAAELAARGHKFRGHSDTEVILESFAENGHFLAACRIAGRDGGWIVETEPGDVCAQARSIGHVAVRGIVGKGVDL